MHIIDTLHTIIISKRLPYTFGVVNREISVLIFVHIAVRTDIVRTFPEDVCCNVVCKDIHSVVLCGKDIPRTDSNDLSKCCSQNSLRFEHGKCPWAEMDSHQHICLRQ